MARKNRISVPDGIYHVTTRVAHGAMLFRDDCIKERILAIMYKVAAFSGIELYAWCIMDNHIHMLVHVPKVPGRYLDDPEVEPAAYAFGMRPAECRVPLWSQDDDGIPISPLPRPPLGFMLDDGELAGRIRSLYGAKTAERTLLRWEHLTAAKLRHLVDEEKARLCRRMYNISQFMKTFKEHVTRFFNEDLGHKGALWQGRFYSGLVENASRVLSIVAGYIDFNPVKAKLVNDPAQWRWNSFSAACSNGPVSEQCRRMYAKMLGCGWPEAKAAMESIFADRLPDDLSEEKVRLICDYYDDEAAKIAYYRTHDRRKDDETTMPWKRPIRASQAIRVTTKIFKGAFIGSVEFALRTIMALPSRYPMHRTRSARRCWALDWREPMVA